jgi:hypothetical protein
VEVQRIDDPGPNAIHFPADHANRPEYLVAYLYDDESVRTVEFDRKGAHVAEYEGEPRAMSNSEYFEVAKVHVPAAPKPEPVKAK